jgi:Fe-S-cluster formation regulator IscX/YfhJ
MRTGQTDRQTDGRMDRHRQTDGRTDGQTDRQTDRHRQTDRQTDMTKLIVALHNFTSAPKNCGSLCIHDNIQTGTSACSSS